ncbi:unnamed protein product [Cunninghamella blakesleeana]
MRLTSFAIVLATSLCTLVSSQNVNYKVVSVTNSDMGVVINGQTYRLEPSKDIPILYTGEAPVGDYSYAKLDKTNQGVLEKEPFTRSLQQNGTPNEFYNRTWNTKALRSFPQIVDNLPSMHHIDTPLHKEDSITTFYFQGNQADIDLMHKNTSLDTTVIVDMTLIENDKAQTIKGVEIKLAGRSSRWFDKLSYGIKIPKGQDLYGYRRLKLRALRADPAYIREKLCYDLMKSVGLPVSGASYTRIVMNGQPIGLYLMIEAYKNPWYKNVFANGGELEQGINYQGVGSVSDLSYFGDNVTKYDGPYKVEEDPSKGTPSFDRLMEFTKFLSEAPIGEGAEKIWNQHIDMDSVIRSLVIEIAAGFSDGYIANANNFFLYDNLQEKRFTYLAADFDSTMGNTLVKLADQWSGDYNQYPGFNLRPLTKKLVQVPAFKAQLEQLLNKITKEVIDPQVSNQRIDDLVSFVREDVEWDMSLPKVGNFSLGDFGDIGPNGTFPLTPDMLPPPLYWDSILDMTKRGQISFDTAVNGPTGSISLPGVREWFSTISKNTQQYFSQHPPQ